MAKSDFRRICTFTLKRPLAEFWWTFSQEMRNIALPLYDDSSNTHPIWEIRSFHQFLSTFDMHVYLCATAPLDLLFHVKFEKVGQKMECYLAFEFEEHFGARMCQQNHHLIPPNKKMIPYYAKHFGLGIQRTLKRKTWLKKQLPLQKIHCKCRVCGKYTELQAVGNYCFECADVQCSQCHVRYPRGTNHVCITWPRMQDVRTQGNLRRNFP